MAEEGEAVTTDPPVIQRSPEPCERFVHRPGDVLGLLCGKCQWPMVDHLPFSEPRG